MITILIIRWNFSAKTKCQQISDKFADEAKKQFPKLLEIARENKDNFLEFDPANDRLNVLSHRQAAVVRRLSINSSLLVENLSTVSLILQQIVHNHLTSNNLSSQEYEICGKLCKSVQAARGKYNEEIDVIRAKKKLPTNALKMLKRKQLSWKWKLW